MPREVDSKRTRKALRAIRKVAEATGEEASGWEQTFLNEVAGRLETYGSAFNDPAKGHLDEALSRLQTAKLQEIARRARKKRRESKE